MEIKYHDKTIKVDPEIMKKIEEAEKNMPEEEKERRRKIKKAMKESQFEIKMDLKTYKDLRKRYLEEYLELLQNLPNKEQFSTKKELISLHNTMLKFWFDKMPKVDNIRAMNPCTTARYYICSSMITDMQPDMIDEQARFKDI